jgi:hypothetical protein
LYGPLRITPQIAKSHPEGNVVKKEKHVFCTSVREYLSFSRKGYLVVNWDIKLGFHACFEKHKSSPKFCDEDWDDDITLLSLNSKKP